jgi:hypothetical protein
MVSGRNEMEEDLSLEMAARQSNDPTNNSQNDMDG